MTTSAELKDCLTAAGGRFAGRPEGPVATQFGDPQAEFAALTESAGLVDCSLRTQVELTGADRTQFLHNLATQEVRELSPGEGCETFLTNPQGKIVGYVFVFHGEESLVLESAPGQAERLLAHLDRYLIREDVQLHDRTAQRPQLLVAGPTAAERVGGATTASIPLAPLAHAAGTCQGRAVTIRRVGLTAAGGFLVAAAAQDIAQVWESLRDAGAVPCGEEAFDAARIEAGAPLYGRDISEDNLPQEVDRNDQAISFLKGCYVGQETVARIDALGHVNRLLRGVKFSGSQVPAPGTQLNRDAKSAGHVTSAAFSPQLGAPLALAYVRRGSHDPGTVLESPDGAAEVVSLPL